MKFTDYEIQCIIEYHGIEILYKLLSPYYVYMSKYKKIVKNGKLIAILLFVACRNCSYKCRMTQINCISK